MKHHLQLRCQLVECSLLVRTSAADPIKKVCVLDHSRLGQLARYSWPGPSAVRGVRCRARRAAATRRCVPARGEAWHRRQPGEAWRRSRRAKRAGAGVGRGVPSMQQGRACRRHRANRGAVAIAAAACRR